MLLKKAPQNIVQQFSRVNRLQIQSGFAARLDPQNPIAKKSERTIAVGAQAAGAVNMVSSEMPRQHQPQIIIRDFPIEWAKPSAVPLMLNVDPVPRRRRDVAAL